MYIKIIGTGSRGNCTLFRSDAHEEWVMFDCGASKIKKSIQGMNVVGVFITHQHVDHCRNIRQVKDIPIYCGKGELKFKELFGAKLIELDRYPVFSEVYVGPYCVKYFRAAHDTFSPLHYYITDGAESFFYGCDCGSVCKELEFNACCNADVCMIECDYIKDSLYSDKLGNDPVKMIYSGDVKDRIVEYHLCDEDINTMFDNGLRGTCLILGHLSSNYNDKDLLKRRLKGDATIVTNSDCPVCLRTRKSHGSIFADIVQHSI